MRTIMTGPASTGQRSCHGLASGHAYSHCISPLGREPHRGFRHASSTGKGGYQGNYSFKSRFEEGEGTNPEELIGAAHAGCFSMAFSKGLADAGFPPNSVETTAKVHLDKTDAGFSVTRIDARHRRRRARHRRGHVPEDRRGRQGELPDLAAALAGRARSA